MYKKTTAVSEGWKTKSVIPQKMVTLIFEYSDEVGKRKEVINLWLSCPMCGMPKVNLILSFFLPFHILPSGTFRHGNNFGLVGCPESKKPFSHKISDHRCNLSRVENLGNLI